MFFKRVFRLLLAIPMIISVIIPHTETNTDDHAVVIELTSVAAELDVNVETLMLEESEDISIIDEKAEGPMGEENMKQPGEEEAVAEELTEGTEPVEETQSKDEATEPAKEETAVDKYAKWHTGTLTARKGYITDGPAGPNGNDGYETWYDLNLSRVVEIMDKLMEEKGKEDGCVYDYEYWVREDGCKMYGPYIMVAGDIKNTRKRGDIIETSLGTAMVCDHCEQSEKCNPYQIDIATDWGHTYSRRQ